MEKRKIEAKYLKRVDLAKKFGVSEALTSRRVKEIQTELGREDSRYSRYAIAGCLINVAVFIDWQTYREFLMNEETRDCVPPFDINEAERMVS